MKQAETAKGFGLGGALGLGIILNIFLPKGGLYLGSIPLTWGYLYLAPTTLWGIFTLLFSGQVTASRLIAYAATLPFAGVAALTLLSNGADLPQFVVALFVSFALLPFAIYIAFDSFLPRDKVEAAMRFISAGLFYVAIWGIIGFIFSAITKSPLDIPYLTTGGGGDLTSIDRNNLRGEIYKLTSTFNNGNIYGICILMVLPVVAQFSPRWKTNIVKLSILLTLSRSAWVGLICYEFGHAAFVRRKAGTLKYLLIALLISAAVLAILLYMLQADTAFLFDPNLGGRLHIYEEIGPILPFSTQTFDTIFEIVYPSVLGKFGYIGLASFLLAMMAPLGCRLMDPRPLDEMDRTLALGIAIYLLVCWSDGAIMLIPSMLFYWCLATALIAPEWRQATQPSRLSRVPASA